MIALTKARIPKLDVELEILEEERAARLRWTIIKQADDYIVNNHLEQISELIPYIEEDVTMGRYAGFLELALDGAEITDLFLNYVQEATNRASVKKERTKTHMHMGMECKKTEDCFDRDMVDVVPEGL